MKCTLAEALLILDNKIKQSNDLIQELQEVRVNKYRKENGENNLEHEPHENTVDFVLENYDKISTEIRLLKCYIREANFKIVVNYKVNNKNISLYEALLLIKEYRSVYDLYRNLGSSKTKSEIIVPRTDFRVAADRSYELITEPTYNTKKYRGKAEKLESLITKLEIAINQANYGNEIEMEGIELITIDENLI